MKQLSGLDAGFLHMESPTTYGHVNGLALYERPSPDFDPYRIVRHRLGTLVGHIEPLRRRVVEVPFGIDHPYWIDDPHFDLDFHIRQIAIPPPGNDEQLGEQIARIIGRPMDRRHPLWEIYVIEGLAGDRWGMLTKFHHATLDGALGVKLLQLWTDTDPDAEWPWEEIEWEGEEIPTDTELLQHTFTHLSANPARAARLWLQMFRTWSDAAGLSSFSGAAGRIRELVGATMRSDADREAVAEQLRRVTLPLSQAPPTPWNREVGPHRRFAMASLSLDDMKRLKNEIGGTVNDVVMAMVAGALREYLIEHDCLPDEPLRAMVPVSIRTGDEDDPWTNRVTAIVAEMPTHLDDPLERHAACQVAMGEAKQQFDLLPADAIGQATDAASPVVATAALRLVARLSNRMNLPVNLVVSNVPGPREQLYFAGAPLQSYVPISTIISNLGLNVTVHSFLDRIDIGIVVDRDLVPDVWRMLELHTAELDRLLEAAGVEPSGAALDDRMSTAQKVFEKQAKKAAARKSSKTSTARSAAAKRSTVKRSSPKKTASKSSGSPEPAEAPASR